MASTEKKPLKAVTLLRRYARFMDENAEELIGSIDGPVYAQADGIRVSFVLRNSGFPTLDIETTYLVTERYEFKR